jgi:hypothetical protein
MRPRRKQAGSRDSQSRSRLLQEAARLIVEQGLQQEPRRALHKAMQRLGIVDPGALPQTDELERAVLDYQRLFGGAGQPAALLARRRAALDAMGFLSRYQPRLIGSVLDGTAGPHSTVQLQLFADDPDSVGHFLDEHRIPHRHAQQRLRLQPELELDCPGYRFVADGIDFELTVLPLDGLRQAPLERSGERPLARASEAALRQLLEQDDPSP